MLFADDRNLRFIDTKYWYLTEINKKEQQLYLAISFFENNVKNAHCIIFEIQPLGQGKLNQFWGVYVDDKLTWEYHIENI